MIPKFVLILALLDEFGEFVTTVVALRQDAGHDDFFLLGLVFVIFFVLVTFVAFTVAVDVIDLDFICVRSGIGLLLGPRRAAASQIPTARVSS